jgi:hypothetical protein
VAAQATVAQAAAEMAAATVALVVAEMAPAVLVVPAVPAADRRRDS